MMEYLDIIHDNCENHSPIKWWPKFAYHYTDVSNAVSVLSSGFLYSRIKSEKMNLMKNNNASRQVIDMTKTSAVANVRFYFRPLTPTQYHNEGYKHSSLRYWSDKDANVPVPVFLVFDLEKLLKMPETRFSETAQSGYGDRLLSGIEEFSKLNFDKIYSNGYSNDADIKKYRHAELLYPNAFDIDKDNCLRAVLCRNDSEKTTLLNLLRDSNIRNFYKYQSMIKVFKEDVFENNALFITECRYYDGNVSVSFSDTYAKEKYKDKQMIKNGVDELTPVDSKIEFEWENAKGLIHHLEMGFKLNYSKSKSITFCNLPVFKEARNIKIRIYFEDKLMCYMNQSIAEIELI